MEKKVKNWEDFNNSINESADPGRKEDMTMGSDVRGDYALFIRRDHIIASEFEDSIDDELRIFLEDNFNCEPTFFRIIDENGEQERSHGWVTCDGVMQWG